MNNVIWLLLPDKKLDLADAPDEELDLADAP
jgi:hypothetical protein